MRALQRHFRPTVSSSVAALLDEGVDGLGRAAVAEAAVLDAVGGAEVAEVADALARLVDGRRWARVPAELDHLEGEAGGRGAQVGEDVDRARSRDWRQDALLEVGGDAGLVAVGEEGADLDAGGAGVERLAELLGRAGAAGEPEGEAELAHLVEVDHVALAVDRLAALVRARSSPRGGALWPPAVGPSMTKPSTRPLALRASMVARLLEAMMGRKKGR